MKKGNQIWCKAGHQVTSQGLTPILVAVLVLWCGTVVAQPDARGEKKARDEARQELRLKQKVVETEILSEGTRTKQVSGSVGYIDDKTIAIIYKRNDETGEEWEIDFKLEAELVLNHKRNLADINIGDRVAMDYEEIYEVSEELNAKGETARKNRIRSRQAKILTFVAPAPAGFTSRGTLNGEE